MYFLQYDDYGEIINVADYTISESLVPLGGADVTAPHDDDDEQPEIIDKELPTKCIKSVTKLEALCKVRVIDYYSDFLNNGFYFVFTSSWPSSNSRASAMETR